MKRVHLRIISQWMYQRMYLATIAGLVTLLCIISGPMATPTMAAAGDWPTYQFNNAHQGFNPTETLINPATAPNLKLHWTHTAPGGQISTEPVVANGMIYWGSWDGFEHATALNNAFVWATRIGVTTDNSCNPPSVGVADSPTVATITIGTTPTPVVFVGGGNANFYALNANTGAIIWHTPLGSSPSHFLWSSPAVFNGSVYVGMASFGDCPLVQGQMIQMNETTGAIQHVFNTVPNGCTGAGVWGAPTINETTGQLYFVTGNPGGCSQSESLSTSIVRLNASDLSFVSSWQVPASEQVPDSDFGSTPTLFTATINGVQTDMVGVPDKNGTYYAFNQTLIHVGPVWRAHLASGGPCPQCGNGSISPSAWDGKTLYAAGGGTTIGGVGCKGSLRALNPATGAFIWEHCMKDGPVLGAVTAVPGVVVANEGTFVIVVNATTNQTLFRFHDTHSGSFFVSGASISNGVIYVGNLDHNLYALGL